MPCMYNATMQTYFTPSLPTPSLLYSLLLHSSTPYSLLLHSLLLYSSKNILSPVIYMPKFTDRQNIITFAALYN